jgi:hypothetical protein
MRAARLTRTRTVVDVEVSRVIAAATNRVSASFL